jgi:TIGR03009 family protein
MTAVESLVAPNMSRTEVNMTFQQTDVFQGTAKYLKPNLAMLELQKKGNPEQFEKFICTGDFLYQYVPSQKEIRALPMPKPKEGQVAENNFLTFLFGMKAEEAKRRYELKLNKEDQHYVYIDVAPKFDADKADFTRARLVLNKSNFMPRQLWFEQPNKDTVTWDIPSVETKVALKKEEFVSPTPPQGWKFKQVPAGDLQGTGTGSAAPTVIRSTKP